MRKLIFLLMALPLLFAQFSDIQVALMGKAAYITWKTDYNCTGKILYGKTDALGSSATNSTKGLSHGIRLSSLTPGTKYFYKLQCAYNSTTYSSEALSFTTPVLYPDLTIANATSNPAATALGKNITIKAVVKNIGDEKAANVTLRVTCADGSSLTKTISSISVGGSSTSSFTCTPPSETGTHPISVSVDPGDEIAEKSEDNNEGQVSVLYTPQPKPDLSLSPSDVTYQIKEASGEPSISLRIYVNNIGTEKASDVWVCANRKCAKISSISAGSRGYTTIALPADETEITITVDKNGTISELNEENNLAELSISRESTLPDPYITEALITHSPSTLKTGSTVTISAKVYNGGPVTAENVKVIFQKVSTIEVYEEKGEGMEKSEMGVETAGGGIIAELVREGNARDDRKTLIKGEKIGEASISSLSPGSYSTVKATFTIPPDTTSLAIAATVDPENKIREKDEANNIATHLLTIEALYPDLTINTTSGITFTPSAPSAGETLKVKAKIRNEGTLLAQNVPVQFYVSTDGGPFRLFQSKTIDKISAKSTKDLSVEWPVPTGARSATFLVRANPASTIQEKSTANNEANKSINISLPDLHVQSITPTGTVAVGSTITLKAVVKNSGTAKATNVPIVFYYLAPSGDEREIGSKTASSISAGSSSTQSIQWTVPSGIPSNPIVIVRANPSRSIYESDFGNNDASIGLNAQLPDLALSLSTNRPTIVIPTSPGFYSYAQITASVHNVGTAPASNILVQIFADGTKIKEESIPQLNAGASADVVGYVKVGNTYDPGTISFSATVDPYNSVTETLDTNNDADLTSTLANNRPPDAVISVDRSTALRGQYFTFDCLNSSDPEGPYYSCKWRFDNSGDWEERYEVYKSFQASGQHTATLVVTDNYGASDTAQYTVTVQGNQPPVAILDSSYTVYKGEPAWFSPFSSTDPDGRITSVYWNFGDGSTLTESFDSVSHTYSSTGTYTLTMRVTDADGATSTATSTVTVVNPPPTATKSGTEYFISHTYHSPWAAGPQATVYYGIYKVDYKVRYTTNDNVIRYMEYTISSGPAIVTQVTDNDAESLYMDMTATAANGNTALQVRKVEIRNGNSVAWSANGGPHVSGSESPRTMSYSGLEVPMSSSNNYVVVDLDITYPGEMCAAEQYDCQWQVAFWRIN